MMKTYLVTGGAGFIGSNFILYMLERYATIQEQQRQWITSRRTDILFGKKRLSVLQAQEPQFYQKVLSEVGIGGIETAERQLLLYFINQHWADYLSTMEYVREGIHLMVIGGKSPLDEYHKAAISAFAEMNDEIERDVLSSMKKYKITQDGIDMADFYEGLLENCEVDGTWYGLPYLRSTPILYMNTTLLEKAGLDTNGPKTWEELAEYCKTIKEKTGAYGLDRKSVV